MTRYELLDRIGVGGMAEIFRGKAVAAGGFEKPVAIKRILPHLSQDSRFVELLIAEAKVLSLLKHRNITQIFDVGLGDDNQYFLVMEYVDGKDLGNVQRALEARRARMPFDLALHIGAEICEALEHAHIARAPDGKPMSLVHRDVSPSNVLLSRAGEVKLTDFGIAKRAEQEATGHGAVRGKFAYISPEQARNEHIDPRSDVFSVAILMWELITNRRLFSGLGDLEALRAVREAQVPRPRDIDPRIMPEVEALLMPALARDLRERPTAGQLAAQLRSLRYSLEVTVGDPATELAKIIDTADEVQRESQQLIAPHVSGALLPRSDSGPYPAPRPTSASGASSGIPSLSGFADMEHTEATVIRIRTADAFQMRDDDRGMARAREVIDRFEEEETRQAQLSGDQLRILRHGRDTSQVEPMPPPPPGLPGMPRPRRPTDEPTVGRPPLSTQELATLEAQGINQLPPNQHFESDESTRLVARSRDRRTPAPQRIPRPPTAPPPPMPAPAAAPGTVHERNPRQRPPTAVPPPAPQPAPQPYASTHGGGRFPPTPQPAHPAQAPLPPAPVYAPPPPPPWTTAPPPAPDLFDPRASYVQRGGAMQPAAQSSLTPRRPPLQPWILVVGAIVMAALAFAVTRAFLS